MRGVLGINRRIFFSCLVSIEQCVPPLCNREYYKSLSHLDLGRERDSVLIFLLLLMTTTRPLIKERVAYCSSSHNSSTSVSYVNVKL